MPSQGYSGNHRCDLFGIFSDRCYWRGSLLWVVAILDVLNVVVFYWQKTTAEERNKNLLASADKDPTGNARLDLPVGEDLGRFWPSIPDAKAWTLVALAGMSQMCAIIDAGPKDTTISEHMDHRRIIS